MFPPRLSNLILIGFSTVILFQLSHEAESYRNRRRDKEDNSSSDESDSDSYPEAGMPRSIGSSVKKSAANPVTKPPLPFNPTPDPEFKIRIGRRMEEILKAHNESFDEFDNTFYDDYDNEFARGALRYKNFEQKGKSFQIEQIMAFKNRTKERKSFKSLT